MFGVDTTARAAGNEEEFKKTVTGYVDDLDLSEIEEELGDITGYFNGGSLANIIKERIDGSLPIGYEDVFSLLIKRILETLNVRLSQIISVFFIAVFSAIVAAIRPELDDGVGKLCDFLFSVIIIGVVFSVFSSFYNTVKVTLSKTFKIIETVYPVILTLFTAVGAGASGAAFSPAVSFLSGFYVDVIYKILMPCSFISFVFYTIGNISERIKLNKFGDFFKSAFKWIIGFLTFIFCFLMTAQSVTASVFDGFSYKALKYAFSSGVPIVSQMVQGGFDVVFASLVLIKNSVGTVAMVAILLYLLAPMAEIAVMSAIMRLVAALTEPIGADFAKRSLSSCADVFGELNALLICSGICFFLTLFLLVTALSGSI